MLIRRTAAMLEYAEWQRQHAEQNFEARRYRESDAAGYGLIGRKGDLRRAMRAKPRHRSYRQ